jgi:hypothetical protein
MTDHAESPRAPHGHRAEGDAHAPNAGHTAGHPPTPHGHEAPAATPEGENLPFGKVIAVIVISLIIFAVGGAWSLAIRHRTLRGMNPTGAADIPARLGAEELGMVDQIPFELNHWVKDDRAASRERLSSYGWVDRKAGTIHIPIDRAIELQLLESKK